LQTAALWPWIKLSGRWPTGLAAKLELPLFSELSPITWLGS
jgi:hypothetical protein